MRFITLIWSCSPLDTCRGTGFFLINLNRFAAAIAFFNICVDILPHTLGGRCPSTPFQRSRHHRQRLIHANSSAGNFTSCFHRFARLRSSNQRALGPLLSNPVYRHGSTRTRMQPTHVAPVTTSACAHPANRVHAATAFNLLDRRAACCCVPMTDRSLGIPERGLCRVNHQAGRRPPQFDG